MKTVKNHYIWLEKNLPDFFKSLGINFNTVCPGIITAHGDKCYGYASMWKKVGIPFHYGVAIYLLSYLEPYSRTVRQTDNGFINPGEWVIKQYKNLKNKIHLV